MAAAPTESRAGLATKLFYGFGSIAFGVKDNGFAVLLMLYYNQVLGLPARTVGFAIMLALVADACVDPLIGHFSDHLRSRWGRRHPFMYGAALPASLSYMALWNPPRGMSEAGLFGFLVITAIVIRTFISCYEVPSAALAAELTLDYDERTSLLGFRYLFGWYGGLGMGILAFRVFLVPDATHPIGQLNRAGYSAYAVAAGAVMFVTILISAIGTHRRIPMLPVAPPAEPKSLSRVLAETRSTLSHRAFLFLLGSTVCGAISAGVVGGLVIYVNTYFWELTAGQIAVLMLANVISASIAVPTATRLSIRFGKRISVIGATAAVIVLGPLPIVLRLLGCFPANHSASLLPLLFVASAISVAAVIVSSILAASMMADVVEDSQLTTGRRSEGLFFAANAFVLKSVSGLGLGLTGVLLSVAQFPVHASPGEVPQTVLVRLVLMQIGVVTTTSLISIACIARYPISRTTHEENLERLGAAGRSHSSSRALAAAELAGIRSSIPPTA